MARSRKCTSSNQDGKTKTQKLGRGGKKKRKAPNLGIQRNQVTKKLVSHDHENMWENPIGKKQKTEWQMMFLHSLDPIQVSGKMIRDHKEKLQLKCRMT